MKRERYNDYDGMEPVVWVGAAVLVLIQIAFGVGLLWLMWLGIKWLGAHT